MYVGKYIIKDKKKHEKKRNKKRTSPSSMIKILYDVVAIAIVNVELMNIE